VLNFNRYCLSCLLALLAWLPGSALAQSACTSIWGVMSTGGGTTSTLSYFNVGTGQWSQTVGNLIGNANALSVSSVTGILYYVDRTTQNFYSVDTNANPIVSTLIGTIPAPPAPAVTTQILGATTDAAGRVFVYATGPVATPSFVTVAQISLSSAATLTSWTQLRTTPSGDSPTLSASGDSFVDAGGVNWVISNTNPPTLHQLNLNLTPASSFGNTNSPALNLSGVNGMNVRGVATNPLTGLTYMGGFGPTSVAGTYTDVTFEVNLTTGATVPLVQTDKTRYIDDMGSCTNLPAPPTITKSFSPTSQLSAPGTSTVLISIGNSNSVPIYLNSTLIDSLPAGMTVSAVPNLQGSCIAAGSTVTATVGATSASFSSGSRVPAGGCTFSFTVNANAVGTYVNTIPIGSLSTTAGSNSAVAQAVFQVASSDFSVVKQQRVGTAGAFSSSPMSIAGGATLQFSLTIVNGAGSTSTGTVTYVDTLPLLVTPTLSVASVASGGACSTATAVVGGQTRVSGTFTNAPLGGTCTVTITARASLTAVLTTLTNTVSIAPVAPSIDGNPANNTASVVLTIPPSTTLTLTKTDSQVSTVAGSVNTYVITAANLGPSAANGALVRDPVAAGLSCTTVTCATTGGAICPTPPLSLSSFQNAGIPILTFPASSTATFTLSCGVTATGQ
jgi:uncharacterized repeat protein (TIGR01451 family)